MEVPKQKTPEEIAALEKSRIEANKVSVEKLVGLFEANDISGLITQYNVESIGYFVDKHKTQVPSEGSTKEYVGRFLEYNKYDNHLGFEDQIKFCDKENPDFKIVLRRSSTMTEKSVPRMERSSGIPIGMGARSSDWYYEVFRSYPKGLFRIDELPSMFGAADSVNAARKEILSKWFEEALSRNQSLEPKSRTVSDNIDDFDTWG